MRRAFTIVELLVAMGLFGMLLAASGIIFATAVKAHRTAEATAEIARNLAAVTDQLNADFRGLRRDCLLSIWFEVDPCDPCNPDVRHDQILFFANGDFQSYGSPPLIGNTARVYYGQANIMDVDYASDTRTLEEDYKQADILTRRQHIYYSDPCAVFPEVDFANLTNVLVFEDSFVPAANDYYEHDSLALSQWRVITSDPISGSAYNNQIIRTCFSNTSPDGRPGIDLDNAETLHMLMAQGVGHFQIQWAYFSGGQLRWWPSDDPDGDGNDSDSDFTAMGADEFGIYFNMPGGVDVDMTEPPDDENDWFVSGQAQTWEWFFPFGFFPKALMFTFTLYDSRGIFPEGKTFTHIVYLDD